MKRSRVDALIIGSGVGGMCAAARLSAEGMRVCVIERLSRTGGRFSTRDVKGCRLTTGAIMVPCGERSAFQEVFGLLGAPFNVRLSEGGYRYRLSHGDLDVPPEGGGGLVSMFEFALQDKSAAMELAGRFKEAAGALPSDDMSFRQWLSRHTESEPVHNMMQGFCAAFVGTSSHEVPAGEFFRFLRAMGRGNKYGIAVNGNIELMESLGSAIKEKGGIVRTETSCSKIIIEKGAAKGAVVEERGVEEIIEADYVISNTGPKRTIRLAGANNFNEDYLSLLMAHPHETPVFHTAVISREPLSDFQGIYNFGNTKNLIFMESPSLTCPELAPGGEQITTTFGVPASSEAPITADIRRKTIVNILKEIKENFPAFDERRDSTVICVHHGEWPSMRRWPGYPMPVKTPVINLYNVGDGCMPPGTVGVEACALTAKMVAGDILNGSP